MMDGMGLGRDGLDLLEKQKINKMKREKSCREYFLFFICILMSFFANLFSLRMEILFFFFSVFFVLNEINGMKFDSPSSFFFFFSSFLSIFICLFPLFANARGKNQYHLYTLFLRILSKTKYIKWSLLFQVILNLVFNFL